MGETFGLCSAGNSDNRQVESRRMRARAPSKLSSAVQSKFIQVYANTNTFVIVFVFVLIPYQTLQFMHACAPSKLSSVCKPQVYLHLYFYLDLYLHSFPAWANIPIVQLCEETQIHGDTIACTRISNFPKYCQVHASTWKHQQVNCTKCIHPRCFLDCIYSGSAILAL